jgi:hypothetical protein
MDSLTQSAKATRIEVLKSRIAELRSQRRLLLATVATVRLDPETVIEMDHRLHVIQEWLRVEQTKLFDLSHRR